MLGGLGGLVVLALIVLAIVGVVGLYNKLVKLRNRYKNAFSQIDVQLKRRHDLIPNLVETAKGYLRHERETLEAVIAARGRAVQAREQASDNPGDPGSMRDLRRAEGELSGTLGRLFALSESYPDLKADQTMDKLMEELTSTENRIAFARQAFNDAVMRYNTARESFPATLIARNFGFDEAELFEIEEPEQREAPSVSFS